MDSSKGPSRRDIERAEYAAWAERQGLRTPADWQRRKRQMELAGIKWQLKFFGAIAAVGLLIGLLVRIFG